MVLRGRSSPRGYLPVPSVPPEEHGIERPVPHPADGPRAGPAQQPVHLHHQGEGLITQRVRDRASVPLPGPKPPAPRAGAPCGPCACGAGAASRPLPAEAIRAGSALGAGGLAGAGVVGVGGGRVLRRRGRCCRGGRGGGGGVWCGAPAFVGCRGGCTAPAARPAAGAPRPPPPSLHSALPPGLPCPVLPVPGGPRRPCPCPWVPCRPPRLCPPVRAVVLAPCHPRPGLHCRRPCPSCARAHSLGCARACPPSLAPLRAPRGRLPGRPARTPARPSGTLAPSSLPALCRLVRCPRSVPLRCCWPRRPVRVCALAPCRVCPGPPPARAPGHFPCCLLSPAPRSCGWHAALPARRPPLPGSRAGRPAASASAAA